MIKYSRPSPSVFAIKNWTVGRPGNEAKLYPPGHKTNLDRVEGKLGGWGETGRGMVEDVWRWGGM